MGRRRQGRRAFCEVAGLGKLVRAGLALGQVLDSVVEHVVLALLGAQRTASLLVHGLAQDATGSVDARRVEGAAAQGELLQAAALLVVMVGVGVGRVHEGRWGGDYGGSCKGELDVSADSRQAEL